MGKGIGTCGQVRKCDAKVSIDLNVNGIEILVESKYKQMFGEHINQAVTEVLHEYGINNAKVIVEDEGALDFAIKARLKTAIRRSGFRMDKGV